MNFTIYTKTYRYTDTCYQDLSKKHTNITLTIGGDLSYDPTSPGILHEGFVIDNKTVTPKSPNMLFNVERDAKGELTFMHFYACLGKLPPVVGKEHFSYLLYARDPHMSTNQLEDKVRIDAHVDSEFELTGHVDTNATTWQTCGIL